jgi:hypothetical protein
MFKRISFFFASPGMLAAYPGATSRSLNGTQKYIYPAPCFYIKGGCKLATSFNQR